MDKFKKHNFISKEKLANLFNAYDINLELINENGECVTVDTDSIIKTGYAQYTIKDCDDNKFIIKHINEKEAIIKPNKKLKNIFELEQMNEYKGYKKVKPVYKIINSYTHEPFDCDPSYFSAGTHNVELIGILISS